MKPHEPEWLDLADAGQLQKVYFFYLDWPGEELRLHSYIGEISIDGEAWKGFGVIGEIEGNGAEKVSQKPVITLKLSDVPDRASGFMTAEGVKGRTAELYVGAKDPHHDDLRLIGEKKVEFFGRTGGINMVYQETDEKGVRRFDYFVDVEVGRSPRLPLTYYHSDADQRRRTADDPRGPDTAFRHLAAAYSEPPVWTPT